MHNFKNFSIEIKTKFIFSYNKVCKFLQFVNIINSKDRKEKLGIFILIFFNWCQKYKLNVSNLYKQIFRIYVFFFFTDYLVSYC